MNDNKIIRLGQRLGPVEREYHPINEEAGAVEGCRHQDGSGENCFQILNWGQGVSLYLEKL